jgi:hypothetical protein
MAKAMICLGHGIAIGRASSALIYFRENICDLFNTPQNQGLLAFMGWPFKGPAELSGLNKTGNLQC